MTAYEVSQESQRRLNRELRAISSCNQILLRARDEQTLLNEICRIVCGEAGYRMAWVGYRENDVAQTIHPVAWGGADTDYLAQARITWADTEAGRSPCGIAVRSGQSGCIQDFAIGPHAERWRADALQRGYRSCISLPLKDDSQNTFGVLGIYSTEPNAFTPEEVRLLEELAGDLAFGIVVLRTRVEQKRLEQQRQATLHFFSSMDRINRAMQAKGDLEQMLGDVLEVVLSIFDCDRAWLLYPCDLEAPTWQAQMERTRPEFPGVSTLGLEVPVDAEVRSVIRVVSASDSPVPFGPQAEHPLPKIASEQFAVQSMLAMVIYPIGAKPYMFGLHQCSYPRVWTPQEQKLLQAIGPRLADGLSSLLAYRQMQQREREFRSLAENSLDLISRVDTNGRYLYVNPVMAKVTGLIPQAVIGKEIGETRLGAGHYDDLGLVQPLRHAIRQAVETGVAQKCEIAFPDDSTGSIFECRLNPEIDANGQVTTVLCISRDITERKRAEQALRDSEFRFRAVVQAMPVMINALDSGGLIVAWNRECERVSGYLAEEIIGNPKALQWLYPDPAYRAKMLGDAVRDRVHEYRDEPWDMVCKDGSVRTIEWSNGEPQLNIPGWVEWSIGVDVTERRQLERLLLDATRQEQRRLGQELHDGLGQELCGLALLAHGLATHRDNVGHPIAWDLNQIADIASKAIRNCRSIAHGLSPLGERPGGLIEALRELTTAQRSEFFQTEVLLVEDQTAPLNLSLDACDHLYRIAQEALSNALRHANARIISVELNITNDTVRLVAADDGQGLTRLQAGASGLGLRSMRYRAASIGGRLWIGASQGGGTAVVVECPNPPLRSAFLK